MPMLPKMYFNTDVRDVARAHINAMTVPEAAGNQHLLGPDGGWFKDMAKVCSYSLYCTRMNSLFIWNFGTFVHDDVSFYAVKLLEI